MMWTVQIRSNLTIRQLVDSITTSGKMSRQDHLRLTSAILSDNEITEEERRQINRTFDYIQTGRLKLVD
ncbi:hypothetical protein H6F88_05600 [Oculatella sp. FACHB-28]|uniref:hypothetical protein n=1 Tax=Cyanophyceae TaxID=3028117 RepID=UPI0016898535|nr:MULTISPECIES: hypothetical protein [Cyanophyceae]MBD2055500.1 hypothetical protein [Oculatella sp. FACHB-28]MBD2069866.1 hypothetical protein [Leptolyngbya sp. FACHB-671]